VETYWDTDQKEYINKNIDSQTSQATYTTWSLGWLNWDHRSGSTMETSVHDFENNETQLHVDEGTKFEEALKTLYNSEKEKAEVSGFLDVEGIDPYIPTTAFVYVRIVTIKFKDGTTLNVLDHKTVGGDNQGNPLPSSGGQMHIRKIS